ncbi:MAG: hypothetical protein VYE68_01115 [Acidobacteriota bacterium]|nr:hypothetical protein [Acidobacteriota bacterium]
MADVTGGSLARRPAFFLSASLGVALVIGFWGWSATCPCDRMPG